MNKRISNQIVAHPIRIETVISLQLVARHYRDIKSVPFDLFTR